MVPPPPSGLPPPPPADLCRRRKARFREPAYLLWHNQTVLRVASGESVRRTLVRAARALGWGRDCLRHLAVEFRCLEGAACPNPACLRGKTVLRAYDDEEGGCDVKQMAVYLDAGGLEAPFAPRRPVVFADAATGEELLRLAGEVPAAAHYLVIAKALDRLDGGLRRAAHLPSELRLFYDCGRCGDDHLEHTQRGSHCPLREGAEARVLVSVGRAAA